MSAAKALLTGNLTKARQEWKLLNLAMESNPWGLAAAAIATVVAALIVFGDSATAAEEAQRTLNKIQNAAKDQAEEEKTRIELLTAILNNENESRTQKLTAIAKLRELLPDHLKGYSDEKILAGEATGAIQEYINQLEKRAEAEAAYEELVSLKKERNKIITQGVDRSAWQSATAFFGASATVGGFKSGKQIDADNKAKALAKNDVQIKALKENYNLDAAVTKSDAKGGNSSSGGTTSAVNNLTALKAKLKELQDELQVTEIGSKRYIELRQQIAEQEKKINAADGSKTNGTNTAAERLKEFKDLAEQYKLFDAARLADQIASNAKEIAQEEGKYNAFIKKEKDYLAKKGLTQKQINETNSAIAQIEIDKGEAVKKIRIRQEAELAERTKDFLESITNAHAK